MVEELEYSRLKFGYHKFCSQPIISCHLNTINCVASLKCRVYLRLLSIAKTLSIYGQLHSIIILSITFAYPMYEIRRVLCVTKRRIFVSKVIIQSVGWEVYIYNTHIKVT